MQNQLREASDKVTGLQTLQWCDISTPVPIPDNISDYVASDEDSEAGDKKAEDICCLTPIQSDDECHSSSSGSEVDFDDLEEEFWFSSLAPQIMGAEETDLQVEDSEVPDDTFVQRSNSFWSSLESSVCQQDTSAMPGVDDDIGACGGDHPLNGFHRGDSQGHFDGTEGLRSQHFSDGSNNHKKPKYYPSDSEGSDVHSTESSDVTTLKQFKHDTITLLNLLMDEKFAHPYGTIAGSVA